MFFDMANVPLLSIITINYNNAEGLEKTLASVDVQTSKDFEHIIVDGASTDGSVEIIKKHDDGKVRRIWVSEKDNGIYNAMNKGIRMAHGRYLQFLNSGDCLASDDVVETMYGKLCENAYPCILYGNMLKDNVKGQIIRDKGFAGQEITFLGFYRGTLNHSPAYISKKLFEKYGLYDESLKIVADWKWYMQAIIFGGENPVYADLDVSIFDMHGISETNKELDKKERDEVLNSLLPKAILDDYSKYAFFIEQMKRLKRHSWAYKMVWFIERCLFKFETFNTKEASFK